MRSLKFLFGDNLKQQKLFWYWMDFSKVPSKVLSCPMCLVSFDKVTTFFPAVGGWYVVFVVVVVMVAMVVGGGRGGKVGNQFILTSLM